MSSNNTKILLIGASGQVGKELLEYLSEDFEVTCLLRSKESSFVLSNHSKFIISSIDDENVVLPLINKSDIIINAAYSSGTALSSFQQNISLNKTLIKYLNKSEGKLLIHFSTIAVYGNFIDNKLIDFKYPNPSDSYGYNKLKIENLIRKKISSKNISYILRLGHVQGDLQSTEKYFVNLLRENFFGLPKNYDSFSNTVFVKDIYNSIKYISNKKFHKKVNTYNLITNSSRTWLEHLTYLKNKHNRTDLINYLPSDVEERLYSYYQNKMKINQFGLLKVLFNNVKKIPLAVFKQLFDFNAERIKMVFGKIPSFILITQNANHLKNSYNKSIKDYYMNYPDDLYIFFSTKIKGENIMDEIN